MDEYKLLISRVEQLDFEVTVASFVTIIVSSQQVRVFIKKSIFCFGVQRLYALPRIAIHKGIVCIPL